MCYWTKCEASCLVPVSSGFDSCARFWDLRSGKCIMVFEGHLKNVLALDFSPNGFAISSLP